MKALFANTSFFIAFLNARDEAHAAAVPYMEQHRGPFVTTAWVLAELGNYLAQSPDRRLFAPFLRDLQADARFRIAHADKKSFDQGLDLYSRRPDKEWSFTDCISIRLMKRRQLREALTTDRHFEQAGFSALLK